MNMNKIYKSLILLLGIGTALVACRTLDPLVEEIDYDRVLTPLKFEAEVVPSTGTDVVFSWQKMVNAEGYELEIYEQTDGSKEVTPESSGTKVGETYIVAADENPYTVYGLEVDKSYYARIRGINSTVATSNWAYLEKTFSTSAVRSSLNPVVTARTSSSVTIAWDKASDKEDLTSVQVETVVGDGESKKVTLSVDQISAASATIDGLDPAREYRFTLLFGKAGKRGSVTAFTRPVLDGVNTVYTAGEIYNAINNQEGTVKLLLAYSDAGIDMMDAYPDPAVKLVTVKGDVSLYGDATAEGKKPAIKTLVFNLASGASVLHLEDLVLDGNGTGALTENLSADMTAVEYVNCEISGYAKAIYSVAGSAAGANVAAFLVDGCYVHDINAAGTEGGDFIDVRNGVNGSFTVRNSTFYACARTFFRVSDSAKAESILAENCTFNLVTATNSSSNNAGIFAVRVVTGAKSVKAVKCVFLNELSEKEDASTTWVRMCRNSTDSYRVDCADNVYYNTGAAWYVSNAVASETDTQGEKTFEEIAKTGATLLENDPCINSIAGKLYLTGTDGERIKSLKAGDPRWWDAVQPEVIREKELKVVEDDFTWDFTEKTIYDTEELLENTIIGNARIYATATVPANVVMSKGIDFSTTAAVSPAGVPSYSAVEILTSGYGAVKVTATSDANPGTLQVLAGGDRYAVLADGEEHTVLLGDLTGENSIYVIADNAITLKKITWTKDLTPDQTLEILATPKLSVSPAKLDEGTAEPVVFSWAAVENAADYVLTFQGVEYVLTESSYTVDAAVVAALAVGEYPVTVKARPVPTSSKYSESELAEATLTINKKQSGGTEKTLTWDFSTSEWIAQFESHFNAINTNQNDIDFTYDGLRINGGGASMKYSNSGDLYFIQPGGKGSATQRQFEFTAPADGTLKVWASNTGGSEASDRFVTVNQEGAETSVVGGSPAGTLTECSFDVKAGQVLIYPTGNALRFYKIEFTYTEAGAPGVEYDWNFSAAEWIAQFESHFNAINTNQNDIDFTYDGLRINGGGASMKYSNSGDVYFIQPGGKGSATQRQFQFTAPSAGTLTVWASNTGGSEASDRFVTVNQGGKETSIVGGSPAGTLTECVFEIEEGDVLIYPTGNALRFYEIKFVGKGGGAPAKIDYVWGFSSTEWAAALESHFTAINTNQNDIDFTFDGLRVNGGGKSMKYNKTAEGVYFVQPGGAGSSSARCFSFEAPVSGTLKVYSSNTGDSEDLTRMVAVAVGSAEAVTVPCGYAAKDGPHECTFDINVTETTTVTIFPSGNGLRFYSIEFHSN